jgi:hypothetical protein
MTNKQPEPEYIITKSQLHELVDGYVYAQAYEVVCINKLVCARPLPEAINKHNAEVIKELERQRNEAAEDTDDGSIGYVSGMDNAIALIRDGVKKE